MPSTPFIDGLPGSDRLMRRLAALCGEDVLVALRQRMEAAYYAAPIHLLDDGLPSVIESLRARGVHTFGLTSRSASQATWEYAWHNAKIVEALTQAGISFSPLPTEHEGEHGANTAAGGILYAGGDVQVRGAEPA